MGTGPWQQGELARAIEKTERARFRRALRRAKADVWSAFELQRPHMAAIRDPLVAMFDKLEKSISPKKPKEKPKRYIDRAHEIAEELRQEKR